MLLSSGSPGATAQWENYYKTIAYPTVWVLKSVSNPNDSSTGISILKTVSGDPAFGSSEVTCALLLISTSYIASIQSCGQ